MGQVVADVGTGSGYLAMAAVAAGAAHVHAVEYSDFFENAEKNIRAAEMSDRITVYHDLAQQVFLDVR